jgi:hypothetical protein
VVNSHLTITQVGLACGGSLHSCRSKFGGCGSAKLLELLPQERYASAHGCLHHRITYIADEMYCVISFFTIKLFKFVR